MSSSSTTDVPPPRSRRSSTHRSISSAYRQPIWRSPSFIRTTTGAAPAASVSIVFAEPEQGAPLARASSRIPISGSPLSMREMRREEEEENVGDLGVGGHEGNETTPYDAPSSSAQRQSKPNTNSWFSSLTRSKGKLAVRTADAHVQSPSILDPPPHPEIELPTTTAAAQPIPTAPQNIPGTTLPQPQPSLWSSSPPPPSSSPPTELAPLLIPSTPPPTYPLNLEAAAATRPRHEPIAQSPTADVVLTERPPVYTASRSSNKNTLPSPCSVDDRVPSLPPTPPAVQLRHTPLKSPPLEQTTALNPSSSRFTLSIPLLGRAKVPLGSVLGKEKEKEKGLDSLSGNMEIGAPPGTQCKDQEAAVDDGRTMKRGGEVRDEGREVVGDINRDDSQLDDSTAGAGPGDGTAAREISGALAPSVTTSAMTTAMATATAAATAPTPITAPTTMPVGVTDPTHQESNSGLTPSNAPTTATTATTTTATATWWGYVGWGSSIPTTTSGSTEAVEREEAEAAAAAAANVRLLVQGVREDGVAGGVEGLDLGGGNAVNEGEGEGERVQEDVSVHMTTTAEEVVVPDAQVSLLPPPATTTATTTETPAPAATTWLIPWTWYPLSTPTPTTPVGPDAESEKAEQEQHHQQRQEAVGVDRQGDNDNAQQRDSSSPAPRGEGDLAVFPTTTNTNLANGLETSASPHQTAISGLPNTLTTATAAEATNPIASTIASHTSSWASFFSSRSMLVKTLGYGYGAAAPAGLIEDDDDGVKRDGNGVEVMEVDFGGEDGDEEAVSLVGGGGVKMKDGERDSGVERGRGRGVHPRRGKDEDGDEDGGTSVGSMVDEVVGAAAVFKANARDVRMRSQGKVVGSSAPADKNAKTKTPSAPSTPSNSKSASGSSTPALGPSPSTSTSASNKQPPISPSTSTSTSTNDNPPKPSTPAPQTPTTKPRPTTPKPISVPTTTTPKSRTSSPSPKTNNNNNKNSISVPPPPPPNLVLPTWSDTFYSAPRNVVVAPKMAGAQAHHGDCGVVGGKLLGRTMRFVSSVLWMKEGAGGLGGAGTGAGEVGEGGSVVGRKGKERAREGSFREGGGAGVSESLLDKERRERFRDFGKELPKDWSVLEGRLNTRRIGLVSSASRSRVSSSSSSRSTSSEAAAAKANVKSSAAHGDEDKSELHDVLRGCRRVVVIGVHGWFPGAMIRSVLGEPTGTSSKFANMTEQALHEFEDEHGVKFDKITKVPLEGDGTIERRVERLYTNLKANDEWISDLHEADAILVATHSQGSIVSTHLLDRLIRDGHIVTSAARNEIPSQHEVTPLGMGAEAFPSSIGVVVEQEERRRGEVHEERRKVQRVCCLALCGIHLGPLRYLSTSTLVGPYLQYFESTAARELFEFQNTESAVSKAYVAALQNVLDHGTKVLYVASLNDQVVPIYSGLFTAVSHPLILRALYIDGDAYHSSDFLSNLLVLLLRILNSGISDSGLLAHLSEATAGSLNGVGHSTAYEELATYKLAVQYLFLANEGLPPTPSSSSSSPAEHHTHTHTHSTLTPTPLILEPFNATHEQNDYEIPWSLRDIIADERVAFYFGREIVQLRDAFREWAPKTTVLRDLKRKLQPIQRLPVGFLDGVGSGRGAGGSVSKL